MAEIEYRKIDGVRGEFFRCTALAATLSTKACAGFFAEATSARGLDWDMRVQCRVCPIGAKHSGISPVDASASRFLGKLICSRCQEFTRRLIRKSICVSCYNREREVLIGKNAKGTAPVHCAKVSSTIIACKFGDDPSMKVRRVDRVVSRIEAILSVLRTEKHTVSFGWVAPAAPSITQEAS